MKVTSKAPINKIKAAGIAGAAVTLVAWALGRFAGIDLPADVVAALTTVAAFAAGYLVPIAEGEVKA